MTNECINYIEIWGRRKSAPIEGGTRYWWNAEYYTYASAGDDASVRDENHTNELVECLLGKSSMWQAATPVADKDFVPWFTIALGVSRTRQKISHYSVDYHKHNGCPLAIVDQGMGIFRLIKRNIREAIKNGRAKK